MKKQPNFKPVLSDTNKIKSTINYDFTGLFQASPLQQDPLIQAVSTAYEGQARRNNITGFDSRHINTLVRQVLGERQVRNDTFGGPVKVNGQWTIAPSDVKQNEMGSLWKSINDEDLKIAGIELKDVDGKPLSASDLRYGKLVPMGAGRYAVALGDDSRPDYVPAGNTGKPLVIDLNETSALGKRMRTRTPSYFLGGAQ